MKTLNRPAKLAALSLISLALPSCATKDPISLPNYSEIVLQETAKQKAADCAFFAFRELGPLPANVVTELERAEQAALAETATEAQVALLQWLNRDTRKIEMRKTYCGA